MTTIASLGLQIDSGDAVEAKDNLNQLADAGKRSEESAGRTGKAWESALGSVQGDTRQIVQELQALNSKQAELAQQMATVGRAVTSASTAFSSAAMNMGTFRTEAAQAGKVQEALTSATDAGAQAGRRAAESADEQQARILAVAKASLEASQYVQSLNRATEQTVEVTAQANAVLSDQASRQAAINGRAQALLATEERLAQAAKKTAGAQREEGQALEELLGKIDPTALSARMGANAVEWALSTLQRNEYVVSNNAICCPHCQGQNVQLLSVIHAAGTTRIQTTHKAYSGHGPVTVETTGRHQTDLAASVGPPPGKRLLGPVIMTGVGAIILYDGLKLINTYWGVDWTRFFIGATLVTVGVIGFVRHWKFNVAQYDKLEEWRRTWLCHACGSRFQP